jgi:hypothetical protein
MVGLVAGLGWWARHRAYYPPRDAYEQSLVQGVNIPRLRCQGGDAEVGGLLGPVSASADQARDVFLSRRPAYPHSDFTTLGVTDLAVVYTHALEDGTIDTTLTVRSAGHEWAVSAVQWCAYPAR